MHDYKNFSYITEDGKTIFLSGKENQALKLLMDAEGKIVTKEKFSEVLYKVPLDPSIHDSIRKLICILRKKLGINIFNKSGVGYYITK